MPSLVILYEPTPSGDHRVGRHIMLERPVSYLGITASCDFVACDPSVAGVHARIVCDPHGPASIADETDGAPGVFVCDARVVGTRQLQDGDEIRIGDTLLHFIGREVDVEARYHEAIYWLVSHDPITRAARARALVERVEELKAAQRSYFFVRFDFSDAGATFDALRSTAAALALVSASTEVVARAGARSISVMIPDATAEVARARASTFHAMLRAKHVDVDPVITTELI